MKSKICLTIVYYKQNLKISYSHSEGAKLCVVIPAITNYAWFMPICAQQSEGDQVLEVITLAVLI